MIDINKQFIESVKECATEDFVFLIQDLLTELKIYKNDFIYQLDDDNNVNGYVTRIEDNERCYVVACQYDTLLIDVNEINRFKNILKSQDLRHGIYITTTYFSRECLNADKIVDLNLSLLDAHAICSFASKECKEKFGIHTISSPSSDMESTLRQRNAKKKIRVTFPDGKVFCDKSPARTEIQTIEYIGVEKVKDLGMTVCHIPLISDKIETKYKDWTSPIGNGYYIMTSANTDQKCLQLIAIRNKLNLNIKIEMSESFSIVSNDGLNERKKKEKQMLLVNFEDGTSIGNINQTETFIKTIEYLNIEKVGHANVQVSGKPLITSTKQYTNQEQLKNGRWITIPNSTKDKYRTLRVVSSMLHVNIEITIV